MSGLIWDPLKERKLLEERGIHLHEIKDLLQNGQYFAFLDHPNRPEHNIVALLYNGKTHAVIVKVEPTQIILKTCYRSSKLARQFKTP